MEVLALPNEEWANYWFAKIVWTSRTSFILKELQTFLCFHVTCRWAGNGSRPLCPGITADNRPLPLLLETESNDRARQLSKTPFFLNVLLMSSTYISIRPPLVLILTAATTSHKQRVKECSEKSVLHHGLACWCCGHMTLRQYTHREEYLIDRVRGALQFCLLG